jgi:hypothetical protein
MARFILRYTGNGAAPAEVVARLREQLTILEEAPRMLLVDGTEPRVKKLLESLPDWLMVEERSVPLPDTRPRVRTPRR